MSSALEGITTSTVHLLAQGTVERIYGPPGTGRSNPVKAIVREVVEELGPDAVLATSFTVTAARSLIAMGLPLPSHQVGTLHSLA